MEKSSAVTIQDIADKAQVSISTVSRVLNGNESVGDAYKTAVLAAIEELDYQPNYFAQGLAGGQSRTIGVITQNVGSPVYDAILKGVLQGLANEDYAPIFADGQWNSVREQHAVQTLLSKRVDGLIVLGGSLPEETLIQISQTVPLITVGRKIKSLMPQCIYVDNVKAAFDATQLLIQLGHRNIVHVSGLPTHIDAIERTNGYRKAIEAAGLPFNPELLVKGDFRRQSGVMAVTSLLARGVGFTAVFAANDQMAFGVRLALFRQGLRVPEDISIVGYDDQPDSAFMIPPLTTVKQPTVEMGMAAAHAVLALLQGKKLATNNQFPAQLIVRESTARLV